MECAYTLNPRICDTNPNHRIAQNHYVLDSFACRCIRQIHHKARYQEMQWVSRNAIYEKYTKSAITSWIQKWATAHYLKQTSNNWKIHAHEPQNIQKMRTSWIETWGQNKQYGRKYIDRNLTEKQHVKTHIHETTRKRRPNYIRDVFTKWEAYPNTNEMTEKERQQHGNMHLATWAAKLLERELNQDLHQRPTCAREFLSNKALSHHRANKQPCNKQWKEEKPRREIPQKKTATKIPHHTKTPNTHWGNAIKNITSSNTSTH